LTGRFQDRLWAGALQGLAGSFTGLHPLSEMQQNVICSLRSMPMVDDHNPTEFLLRNVWMRIDDREAARVDMAESCCDPRTIRYL